MSGRIVPDPAHACAQRAAKDLVTAAFQAIRGRYVQDRHQIAAAVLDADGRVHLGLHLDAMVGRAAVCAEAGAVSAARLATDAELIAVAAVRYPKPTEPALARIVPPCGLCRELLLDHAPRLDVVVPDTPARLVALTALLPHKYLGTKWPMPVSPT
ncbi:cytidine deaminase [Streptomyces goshikiensis]|uniref:cytidine deaminase n=1 Tax=Streptomyces goshikiensis TaxID=1942 RepID=UPI0037AC4CD0